MSLMFVIAERLCVLESIQVLVKGASEILKGVCLNEGSEKKTTRVEQILCDPSNKCSCLIAAEALQTFAIHLSFSFLLFFD